MSEWISVDERLPDEMLGVLVLIDDCVVVATVYGGVFVKDSFNAEVYEGVPLGEIECQPTHWMPLPEPPKEMDK